MAVGEHRTGAASSGPKTPIRSDAAQNRERILTAARSCFAKNGLDVPMEEVARRAGVGIATLYRRFPTREALISCTFEAKMTAYADAAEAALADPDPWQGFCTYLQNVVEMQAADYGFADVLVMSFPAAKPMQAERERAHRHAVELVKRAQSQGKLRPDFVPEDLVMLLMATAGVISATGDTAPQTWKRLLAFMIQSFANTDHLRQLPPAATPTAMYKSLLRLNRPRQARSKRT